MLLLDEPTKNLDIRHSIDIMNLIKKRNRTLGITVVSVLHDIDLAARVCDEVALMKRGKVLVKGPVEKVLTEKWISKTFDIDVKVKRDDGFHIQVKG